MTESMTTNTERKILPCTLAGEIQAIPSKSLAHRALICAALCQEPTEILLNGSSQDIQATVYCLEALGATIITGDESLSVLPIRKVSNSPLLDCGESGSTLRFLLPVAAALSPEAHLTGGGRLPERPMLPLLQALALHGVSYSSEHVPLRVSHWGEGGDFSLPGNVSSQFASGLLLAAPILGEEVRIHFSTPPESLGYLDLTCQVMASFGIEIQRSALDYMVPAGQAYRSPGCFRVEGDWSNAAFWLVAGANSAQGICIRGMNFSSAQMDRKILFLLEEMGAETRREGDALHIRNRGRLQPIRADVKDVPDIVPILAVAAACAAGPSHFQGVSRLRLKESDRLMAIQHLLGELGGKAEVQGDSLLITGVERLRGGRVQSFNDHRIAMAAAIAAEISEGPLFLQGSEAVRKSYPGFWQDYKKLGGNAHVI